MKTRGKLIIGTGLAGVGKTTHLKALAASIPDSLYLDKDEINIELGQEYNPDSDYYKKIIAPATYKIIMERATTALTKGKTVICDGYFGNKLTASPVREHLIHENFSTRIIYFHCSSNKQQERLTIRGLDRDRDKQGDLFISYRKQHLEDHVRELSQVPYLVIDTENTMDLKKNIDIILKYLKVRITQQQFYFNSVQCQLSVKECSTGAVSFSEILERHKKEVRPKFPAQASSSEGITSWAKSKKVVLAGVSFGALYVGYNLFARNTITTSKPITIFFPKM